MTQSKHDDPNPGRAFASLSPPVWRGSTVVFDSIRDFCARAARSPDGFSYGITGTPTARLLEDRIAALENGKRCVIAPSGAAALMMVVMSYVRAGDHLLLSAASYSSLASLADKWLANLGVEVEYYPPRIGAEIEERIRPNTRMICLESPGSITMEMSDVPAIAEVARRHGVLTMIDNTWASPLGFRPLDHGVDFSVEAATKFFSGHSDVMMGSVAMQSEEHYAVLRDAQGTLGLQVSPEDCFLVLRGLETLAVRVRAQGEATYRLASWLESQPLVDRVWYPPLASDPGHAWWKRDYRSKGCLFSLQLAPAPQEAFEAFFDALRHFSIGASWGGVHSLAAYYPAEMQRIRRYSATDRPLIRLAIGLEEPDALQADLAAALGAFAERRA
ncbi:cystathionine beta-lyase [Bordetella sp. 02P26C-1]|uniref:cystathionine beta-lyase n=1 Tax=Bordetella sp. 02P26C-1 TaxID=2683195 RepID=UPI001354CFE1|nr:cystathionine beta-lyase [Bordetella sp. 02P26C-1]MVW78662.1 cystathionine beta-lyase [Bordetella sp. 02P26C-1]